MDDKTDEMMVEWFKLVMKRNELVREESALIYTSVSRALARSNSNAVYNNIQEFVENHTHFTMHFTNKCYFFQH